LNGKIQEIKLSAKGYGTFENFRAAILFYHGKLDLYPQQNLVETKNLFLTFLSVSFISSSL